MKETKQIRNVLDFQLFTKKEKKKLTKGQA